MTSAPDAATLLLYAGPAAFGTVVGWITYRTLRRKEGPVGLSDLSAVIAAVGGGGVTALFREPLLFSAYCVGLAAGFFGYLAVAAALQRTAERREQARPEERTATWMGGGGAPRDPPGGQG